MLLPIPAVVFGLVSGIDIVPDGENVETVRVIRAHGGSIEVDGETLRVRLV